MKSIRKHLASYRFAMRGIILALLHEHNMRYHIAAAIVVILLNIFLKISRTDWIITIILIGLLLMAEIFNTAIERLADRVTKEHDPLIGETKDLAAGAVLIIGIFACIGAMLIYLPYL